MFVPVSAASPTEIRKQEITYATPELKRICSCESTGRPDQEPQQFDKEGNVVIGKINPLDTGACQINLHYHGEAAQRLGYDLFSRDGNIGYANHLYQEEGSTPWNWSRHCWLKEERAPGTGA